MRQWLWIRGARFPRPGMTTLKLHLRRLADGLAFFAEIEELLWCKAERGGKQGSRETLNASVVFLHGVVEEAARRRDLVLDVGQLGLQLLEVGVGFQIGIRLRQGKELAQRAAQLVLRRRLLRRALCGHRGIARPDHFIERAALVGSVTL